MSNQLWEHSTDLELSLQKVDLHPQSLCGLPAGAILDQHNVSCAVLIPAFQKRCVHSRSARAVPPSALKYARVGVAEWLTAVGLWEQRLNMQQERSTRPAWGEFRRLSSRRPAEFGQFRSGPKEAGFGTRSAELGPSFARITEITNVHAETRPSSVAKVGRTSAKIGREHSEHRMYEQERNL